MNTTPPKAIDAKIVTRDVEAAMVGCLKQASRCFSGTERTFDEFCAVSKAKKKKVSKLFVEMNNAGIFKGTVVVQSSNAPGNGRYGTGEVI